MSAAAARGGGRVAAARATLPLLNERRRRYTARAVRRLTSPSPAAAAATVAAGRSGPITKKRYTASVLAILKDERDVEEWLAYHALLGFEHFYLYDNGSSPPLSDVLLPRYANLVTLCNWNTIDTKGEYRGPQKPAYNDFLHRHGSQTEWVAVIDGDEYVRLRKHASIQAFLRDYADVDSVALHWRMFGGNGRETRPRDGTLAIEAYTRCARDDDAHNNGVLKRIVRPAVVLEMDVHQQQLVRGARDVDTLHIPLRSTWRCNRLTSEQSGERAMDVAQLNHYWTKSREDWNRKVDRGRASGREVHAKTLFDAVQRPFNAIEDTSLLDEGWPERVRAFIAARAAPAAK